MNNGPWEAAVTSSEDGSHRELGRMAVVEVGQRAVIRAALPTSVGWCPAGRLHGAAGSPPAPLDRTDRSDAVSGGHGCLA